MSPVLEPFAKRLSAVPLRLRLVAIVLALLVTALSVSGVASGLLIRKYLTDRVDQELRAYADVAALVAAAQARSGSALSPVSYTHLDVYKRQGQPTGDLESERHRERHDGGGAGRDDR